MISNSRMIEANCLAAWLTLGEHCPLPQDRARTAASCFGVAQEHHHAILALLFKSLYAPAYSLLRLQYEAYVRGLWLMDCASDAQVDAFVAGRGAPEVDELVTLIEDTPAFARCVLTGVRANAWRVVRDYWQTVPLQRWTISTPQPNYTFAEADEVLHIAEIVAVGSTADLAQLAGNDKLAGQLLAELKLLVGARD